MNKEEKYAYWLDVAEYDLQSAEAMFASRRWVYVVFMCQQAIEKLMKGLYVYYIDDDVPRIHTLGSIYERLEDKLPTKAENKYYALFDRLTAYYIKGRYPGYKEKISKSVNKEVAQQTLNAASEAFKWLLTLKQ
jgi:HEPN domain-containing protein